MHKLTSALELTRCAALATRASYRLEPRKCAQPPGQREWQTVLRLVSDLRAEMELLLAASPPPPPPLAVQVQLAEEEAVRHGRSNSWLPCLAARVLSFSKRCSFTIFLLLSHLLMPLSSAVFLLTHLALPRTWHLIRPLCPLCPLSVRIGVCTDAARSIAHVHRCAATP